MSVFDVLPSIKSVGVSDWDVRFFHGPAYSTHRGTTYNAYLVLDEKVALVDTVHRPFAHELLANIDQVDPGQIDYVIVNHIEPDHSGSLPVIMERYPQATIVCTAKAKAGLLKYYGGDHWQYKVVKTGDTLDLGKRQMAFVETPMMHWPDNMVTYIPQDKILLSNDAFGQHFAWSHPFDDQNDLSDIMTEAVKYYANILMPFNRIVARKLQEIEEMNLDIEIIAPGHGVIWRKHPGEILAAYKRWSNAQAENKVLVAYDTMWGSTEKMARAIVEGIAQQGTPVRLYKASANDRNDIIGDLLEAKGIIVGSSTINNDMLNPVSSLLEDMRGLKPSGKVGAAFGSHGWRGGAADSIEQALTEAGVELKAEALTLQWAPDEEFLARCRQWGADFADQLK